MRSEGEKVKNKRQKISEFIDGHWDEFVKAWGQLEPKDKMKYMIEMLRYVVPSYRPVDGPVDAKDNSGDPWEWLSKEFESKS